MPRIPETDIDRPELQTRQPGAYPWDHWQTSALAAGLAPDLATLGRAVMREAVQHNWRPELQEECGWSDNGEQMLELASDEPEQAAERWEHLLVTDGEIGCFNPETNTFELY